MKKKGFTLIELLVVIAIISLLSSIVMASLSSARMKSRTVKSLADLRAINIALLAYYAENGSYPNSGGNWDGYCSAHGDSLGADWIPGLIPKYIPSLPKEPLNHTNCSYQYIYKSDGINYKLIWHNAEDMAGVASAYPQLLDPKRSTYSYGYWSPGAATGGIF